LSLRKRLPAGSLIVFLDNRYVEGSSTPISGTDEWGNSYQDRRLNDGTVHRVLKNFPDRDEINSALEAHAGEIEIIELRYYWLVTCRTK
jgi:demethylmenaquinone methyltransferase/2-methoxy-6-polyprenyl-1,4-benzoquinol methylase